MRFPNNGGGCGWIFFRGAGVGKAGIGKAGIGKAGIGKGGIGKGGIGGRGSGRGRKRERGGEQSTTVVGSFV